MKKVYSMLSRAFIFGLVLTIPLIFFAQEEEVVIKEGEKERIQVFQGVVISKKKAGSANASFTVRKVSYGVGVERIFPLHSPIVDKIEVVTRGRVRRAKIYYLRKLRGKAARIKERRFS